MILILGNLNALLAQLVCSEGIPHTAILVSRANGSVIAQQSTPSLPPFPPQSLADRDDEERAKLYAAVGTSGMTEAENSGGQTGPALKLDTALGRIAIIPIHAYLLILVGSEVSPWAVLEKKLLAASEVLSEPLMKIEP